MQAEPDIRRKIAALFTSEDLLSPEAADELAFHLTDWLGELRSLVALFDAESWNGEEAPEVIRDFVAHAPQHLAAAHLILFGMPVMDVFGLGAVQGSGDGRRQPGAPYAADEEPGQL